MPAHTKTHRPDPVWAAGRARLVISWNQRLAPKFNKGRFGYSSIAYLKSGISDHLVGAVIVRVFVN